LKPYGLINIIPINKSPPARGRGLKRLIALHSGFLLTSPPARGRGLKRGGLDKLCGIRWSPPARGRGLKRSPDISI